MLCSNTNAARIRTRPKLPGIRNSGNVKRAPIRNRDNDIQTYTIDDDGGHKKHVLTMCLGSRNTSTGSRTPGGSPRGCGPGLRPQSHETTSTPHPRRPGTAGGRTIHKCSVHKDPRARDIRMHALTSTPKLSNINLAVERCAVKRTILQALCPELLLISAHHALVDCPKRMDPTYAPLRLCLEAHVAPDDDVAAEHGP